jgi:hypothetical protein
MEACGTQLYQPFSIPRIPCFFEARFHDRTRCPPPPDRPAIAVCPRLVRRRCILDRFLQRPVDELPFGEQFFIDAVRDAVATLPPEVQEKHRADVRGFIGQEATHRRIHSLFNNAPREPGPGRRLDRARQQAHDPDGRKPIRATRWR